MRWSCTASLALIGTAVCAACIRDTRDIHAAREVPERNPSALAARTYSLCRLIGPSTRDRGVYGTDLGYTVKRPGGPSPSLAVLFGDTWARPADGCSYPVARADDMIASLPLERPRVLRPGAPVGGEGEACRSLRYALEDPTDSTSWQRARLFPSAVAESRDAQLDLGALRTPVAAFSDGQRLYAIFYRGDPALCDRESECPPGMVCSRDPGSGRRPLGACAQTFKPSPDSPPAYCRDDADCVAGVRCERPERGVCLAQRPFAIERGGERFAPIWYRDDPRRGIASVMYIAAALRPERPGDFAVVHRFVTHRFTNVVARTVAYFDPDDPSRNDYRPGFHTLLLWGRPAFVEQGGAQSLPFLLYQPLAAAGGEAPELRWQPRFFAGYGPAGEPRWSAQESDAQPIYGADVKLVRTGDGPRLQFPEPEFDIVNQMTVSYLAPLKRWVMLYGGDVPAFMLVNPSSGETPQPTHLQRAPGAIHMRTALHPWGRLSADRPVREGWSSPRPVLTRSAAAPYLACGDGGPNELPGCVQNATPGGPFDSIASLFVMTPERLSEHDGACLEGEFHLAVQAELSGNLIGRLYAPNVIDEWTEDVSDRVSGLGPGERAVEIYWNVSTWSPYQVVLFKTQLRGRPEP